MPSGVEPARPWNQSKLAGLREVGILSRTLLYSWLARTIANASVHEKFRGCGIFREVIDMNPNQPDSPDGLARLFQGGN